MPIYLHALALQNYRGIGPEIQRMPKFKEFNFFIGANNAGKSTVLNFISRHLPRTFDSNAAASDRKIDGLEVLERHRSATNSPIFAGFGFHQDHAMSLVLESNHTLKTNFPLVGFLRKILSSIADSDDLIWKFGELPYDNKLTMERPDTASLRGIIHYSSWQDIWSVLTGQTGGDIGSHWIPQTVTTIENCLTYTLPKSYLIPAIRQIGPKGMPFADFSGAGIIDQLAALQNPEHDRRSDREKFNRINGFLQSVTGKVDAQIEIPYSREHILVHMDGRVLPLESLGTGIHEVIMIAAFCTIAHNEIVCIEEPEIHLHPLLQRKLIRYLQDNTKNQYFIATHSASFIDTPDAAIFHVYQEDNTTRIREAILKQDRYRICLDLGHRASDIIQANAVVWVEGPSDRIYLKHWLGIAAPELVESVHYSIMFYGGRLLSHLSASDEEVSDFIQLRDLNRNVAILMDSDKRAAQSTLNETKRRIRDEFSKGGGMAWVTDGREVENYIDHTRLQAAVAGVYGEKYGVPLAGGRFDHALHFQRSAPKTRRKLPPTTTLLETDVDKVKVSRVVVADGIEDLGVLDLRKRIGELVALIRKANS